MNVTDCFVIEVLLDTLLDVSLEQWLSTFLYWYTLLNLLENLYTLAIALNLVLLKCKM